MHKEINITQIKYNNDVVDAAKISNLTKEMSVKSMRMHRNDRPSAHLLFVCYI